MPARARNSLTRISCSVAFALAVIAGMGVALARAGALDEAFPATDWRRGKSPTGIVVDCVQESCAPPAHVAYTFGPANPAMAEKIKSGAINRKWADKLADSYRKSQGDKITVVSFSVQTGQMLGWSMIYECNCEGTINFVASRVVAGGKGTMTFYSFARTAEAAQANMNKMIIAVLGMGSR